MAGIIFMQSPRRLTPRTRLDRRLLISGAAALAGTALVGRPGGNRVSASNNAEDRATPAASPVCATPVAGGPQTPFERMLALVSVKQAAVAATGGLLYSYADLGAQFSSLGVDRTQPDWTLEVELLTSLTILATASQAFQYAMSEDFRETLGFEPLNVDRALETGTPPEMVSIFQGGLDPERLVAAWKATGFERQDIGDGIEFWTLGEEGEVDLSSPIARFGAGAFNNLMLLNDDTLVTARMGSVLRDVAKQAATASTSLFDLTGIAAATRALSPKTVSSIGVTPNFLTPQLSISLSLDAAAELEKQFEAIQKETGKMPPISVAIFGIEAGVTSSSETPMATPIASGTTDQLFQARIGTTSAANAELIAEIVSERWAMADSILTEKPYRELLTLVSAHVSDVEETVAAIDFDAGDPAVRWLQLVMLRDLLPFAP